MNNILSVFISSMVGMIERFIILLELEYLLRIYVYIMIYENSKWILRKSSILKILPPRKYTMNSVFDVF